MNGQSFCLLPSFSHILFGFEDNGENVWTQPTVLLTLSSAILFRHYKTRTGISLTRFKPIKAKFVLSFVDYTLCLTKDESDPWWKVRFACQLSSYSISSCLKSPSYLRIDRQSGSLSVTTSTRTTGRKQKVAAMSP
jgi:hypothetical protein